MHKAIRIGVVDPYPLYRQGVVQTIMRSPDLVLVTEGEVVADARRALQRDIDILLFDITILQDLQVEARELAHNSGACKLVVLTGRDDLWSVSTALGAGVRGYLLKGISGGELITGIKAIHAGEPLVTSELASRLLVGGMMLPRPQKQLDLSDRERQVLNHLSQGLTNKEIAAQLGLHVTTIKFYLTALFKKLNVTNRVQAMTLAQEYTAEVDPKKPLVSGID
jgi:DNA-binding NarL/FixJ family response regulator